MSKISGRGGVSACLGGALALALLAQPGCASNAPDLLRTGGLTLFMRHAPTDWSEEAIEFGARAAGRFDSNDCRTQRNLSQEGRDAAKLIGMALKNLELRIVEVDAAPLCRAVDTARIGFGQVKIVYDLAPRLSGALAGRAALERIVNTPTPDHALRIIVGDYETAQALFGRTLGEGDALLLKPSSRGSIEMVGAIALEDWRVIAPIVASGAIPVVTR